MFTPQLNYSEKLLWFAFAVTPARKTQSQPGRSGLSYLGACSGTLPQRWRRCVEASRASSSPCTSQWCSPSRWVGSCRGWWPHKRGQNMSVIEQTEQKKKSEKVITLFRKGELYKHFGKNNHMTLSIPCLQVQYSKLYSKQFCIETHVRFESGQQNQTLPDFGSMFWRHLSRNAAAR